VGLRNPLDALTERKIHGAVGNQTPTILQVVTLPIGLILFQYARVSKQQNKEKESCMCSS